MAQNQRHNVDTIPGRLLYTTAATSAPERMRHRVTARSVKIVNDHDLFQRRWLIISARRIFNAVCSHCFGRTASLPPFWRCEGLWLPLCRAYEHVTNRTSQTHPHFADEPLWTDPHASSQHPIISRMVASTLIHTQHVAHMQSFACRHGIDETVHSIRVWLHEP
jgi:hypothetical protein